MFSNNQHLTHMLQYITLGGGEGTALKKDTSEGMLNFNFIYCGLGVFFVMWCSRTHSYPSHGGFINLTPPATHDGPIPPEISAFVHPFL